MSDNNDKNEGIIAACCIGILIIALIIAGVSMFFKDNPNHTANLVLGGKEFSLDNMTEKEISNIQGNNSDSITINNEEGRAMYMIYKSSNSTTILNELTDRDKITNVKSDGINYQNIILAEGGSVTIFKTNDGNIYEIMYYNGNDFMLDYQKVGNQLNK